MGMAASQGRLLALTSRNLDIGRQLSALSMQKMCLTREMKKVSLEYNDALSTKTLKWTNNGGASYVDLTYSSLMTPSSMNQYASYLLTDTSGKIVLDYNYKQYAEMISPDGKGGASWDGDTRVKILAQLTGLKESDITNHDTMLNDCIEKEYAIDDLEKKEPNILDYASTDTNKYLKKTGLKSGQEYSVSELKSRFLKLAEYTGGNKDAYTEAINTIAGTFSDKVNYDAFASQVLTYYQNDIKSSQLLWWESGQYAQYQSDHKKWEDLYYPACETFENAANAYDASYTKDQERQIKHYDKLFSSIAEKGWTYNNDVSDKDYLNQMLQNNMYTITVPSRETQYNTTKKKCESFNTYDTTLASNFGNVVSVNDDNITEKAMSEYQYKKSLINEKESRIDLRMENLKTEQSAIKQMIEGIEKVKDDNIERTFSLFS